ncbi:hypothetical protein AXF42_Ash018113 [Apostasia shenzhenica]|uniref:C2HC zinc finger plants domain-containing protein n=1 Tax=Apostasia shenzhenica TaxID=1088818 RepID=A0A2I0AF00_9ASPA|nr:hypothetical protein AXF42_Ash018113 [Apostasia shenzhenica]
METMETDVPGARGGDEDNAERLVAAVAAARLPPLTGRESTWALLDMARQLVIQGKPSLALRAVVMAMRSEGGEQAVIQALNRARELYRSRLQAEAATDELASLFAECAIAEARQVNPNFPLLPQPPLPLHANNPALLLDIDETSILATSGRKQIMLDAFSDGSSFICLKCGGLVSKHRKDEHYEYWCG